MKLRGAFLPLAFLASFVACAQAQSSEESDDEGGTAGSGTAGSGTAGSGTSGSGTAGKGTSGSGTAGSGTSGSGTAGKGTSGSGTAGSGTSGSGSAGKGTSGSGTAGSGTAGSGTAGSGTAGSGTAGSGIAGSGTAGSGTSGSGTAGSGTAGTGTAGSGTAGSGTNTCAHPICQDGAALDAACDPCVATVCAQTPDCCDSEWTTLCTGYAADLGCGCGNAVQACVDVQSYNGTQSASCSSCLAAKCTAAWDGSGIYCDGTEDIICSSQCSGDPQCFCQCFTGSAQGVCYHVQHDLYTCAVASCAAECM